MKQALVIVLVALFAFTAAVCAKKDYSHHKLVRINVASQEALDALKATVGSQNLDVWSYDGRFAVDLPMDIMMPSAAYEKLQTMFDNHRPNSMDAFNQITVSQFELVHDNIQNLIDETVLANAKASNDDWFTKYHTYEEIQQFTRDMNSEYPAITSYFTIGKSWENRDIFGIKISVNGTNAQKPILLLNSLQHAREWISAAVTTYAMRQFLQLYTARDQQIVDLLNKIDVIIIPLVNPDGYAYTHKGDRLWRKNRRADSSAPYGVDLNRNWKVGYGVGASTSPTSDTFKGPSPLSEKETIAYDAFIRSLGNLVKAGIDFHSYSQLVLRPWDYQYTASKDENALRVLGGAMQSAIAEVHGVKYQNIRGVELYPAGGALNDNFYGAYGFTGYTIELRDTGRYGFLLPPAQIIPTSEENWKAILVLADYVAKAE